MLHLVISVNVSMMCRILSEKLTFKDCTIYTQCVVKHTKWQTDPYGIKQKQTFSFCLFHLIVNMMKDAQEQIGLYI